MPDGTRRPRSLYTPQTVAACEKALRTVLSHVGPWGSHMVLVGGLAPGYLCGVLPPDMPPHIGTTDVDVVIGVALEEDDAPVYRTLQQNLVRAQFAPSRDPDTGTPLSYRWERRVDSITVALEFLCPVGEGTPGRLKRNPADKVGSRISAIRVRGAELVLQDYVTVPLDGETLDHGGIREGITVKVANVLPLLVLKAFALHERVKDKDAYDVVWTLNAYRQGPASVAKAARASPVFRHSDVIAAVEILKSQFRTPDHSGPAGYARFEASMPGDMDEQARLRRHAYNTVQELLRVWGEM